jgi:mannose-6-phosphate isomerase-like protein (cupin superfamily)
VNQKSADRFRPALLAIDGTEGFDGRWGRAYFLEDENDTTMTTTPGSVAINIDRVQRDWRARGIGFAIWAEPPGQVCKSHEHEGDELIMLVEGEVEIEMQGRVCRLNLGEEVLIPGKTLHVVRNVGKTMATWLYGCR